MGPVRSMISTPSKATTPMVLTGVTAVSRCESDAADMGKPSLQTVVPLAENQSGARFRPKAIFHKDNQPSFSDKMMFRRVRRGAFSGTCRNISWRGAMAHIIGVVPDPAWYRTHRCGDVAGGNWHRHGRVKRRRTARLLGRPLVPTIAQARVSAKCGKTRRGKAWVRRCSASLLRRRPAAAAP